MVKVLYVTLFPDHSLELLSLSAHALDEPARLTVVHDLSNKIQKKTNSETVTLSIMHWTTMVVLMFKLGIPDYQIGV